MYDNLATERGSLTNDNSYDCVVESPFSHENLVSGGFSYRTRPVLSPEDLINSKAST